MKYLLLINADPTIDGTEAATTIEDWLEKVKDIRLDGDRLVEPTRAATVRVRGGERVVSDGPFAETKEQIAGFDILECTDLAHAVEMAAAHPMAEFGSVEVRQFWDESA